MKRRLLAMLGSVGLLFGGVARAAVPTPTIVATKTFLNQATSIPTTTLYTVPANGTAIFRVTVYGTMTNPGPFVTVTPAITWTDESNSGSANTLQLSPGPGGQVEATIPVRALANTTISFSGTASSSPTPNYDVFIVVEKLA